VIADGVCVCVCQASHGPELGYQVQLPELGGVPKDLSEDNTTASDTTCNIGLDDGTR